MGDVGFVYRSSVALGCLVLMLASIACTGWFFYTWIGGIPGIVGASVGCAVQIMAYGFSGVIVHHRNGVLRTVLLILIASALSLSVLSSYATLNGYFTALQAQGAAQAAANAKREQAVQAALAQRMQLMESMSRDVEIGSEAADQGISDKYRTQANQFLKSNAETRSSMIEQIEKVEALAQSDLLEAPEEKEASPIDGLSGVLGGKNTVIMVLCIWLAIMFDALPIVGITLFETRTKQKRLDARDQSESSVTENKVDNALEDKSSVVDSATDKAALSSPTAAFIGESPSPILLEVETSKTEKDSGPKLLTNICSMDLQASKAFYVDLLGFETKYDSDWYVQLCSPFDSETEFGVIQRDHELVPSDYQRAPSGMYMTFVVPDVNDAYERAQEMGVEILQEPRNEFYGQRRFLVKEPSGCLVDICSPWDAAEGE